MATLTGEQLKYSYQSLVTIGDSITSDPTSGQLENGKGTALTSVGIGTDSPTSFLPNGRELVLGNGSASHGMTIFSDSSGTGNLFFADGTTGDEAYRGFLRYSHADDAMIIFTAGANERMRIDSDGNLDMTAGGGNIILDSGAGIDFSDTPNSSGTMTSELLDDYEEGTWTPAYKGITTDPSVTYSTQSGTYVKIGNQVTVWFFLRGSFDTGGSGALYIGGLPFTSTADLGASISGSGSISQTQDWFSSEGSPNGVHNQNNELILFTHESSDATSDKNTTIDANFTGGDTNDNRCVGVVTYTVS